MNSTHDFSVFDAPCTSLDGEQHSFVVTLYGAADVSALARFAEDIMAGAHKTVAHRRPIRIAALEPHGAAEAAIRAMRDGA